MRSSARTQLDFLRLKEAGALAQCFAVFLDRRACRRRGVSVWQRYERLRDLFYEELKKNQDVIRQVRTADELTAAARTGVVGAVFTVEGGELLGGGTDMLRTRLKRMWSDGVRLLTLTWNYENALGYPNGSGGGLKKAGFEAVAFMQELGMLVDVSHLSDRGFWDVMGTVHKPVAASHSCARSLCGHPRNLTDAQLRAIGENGGVVGVNFHAPFLRDGGVSGSVEETAHHLRHIISCAGSDAAAFGSDYDGMQGTPEWGGCEGMPRLIEALSAYFDAGTLEKLCYRNAERLFRGASQ